MHRRLLLSILILTMLLLSGCLAEVNLKVSNHSSANVTVWIGSGFQLRHIQPQGHAILSIPVFQITQVHYEGDHIKLGSMMIEAEGSGTEYLQLNPDCGALKLINSSSRDLRELNVRPSGGTQWSENKLRYSLMTGEDETISLEPGFWEFRIRDHFNNTHYITAQEIKLDVTKTYNFLSTS